MDDEKLIILVEENDILYNKFNKNYRMPDKKRAVWAQISKEMGIPEELCIKRWTSLRDRYAKEKRCEKLASGSEANFIHRWHYMSQLEFLAPHVVSRPVRSTINIVEQSKNVFSSHSTPQQSSNTFTADDFEQCFLESQDSLLSTSPTVTPESSSQAKQRNKKRRDDDCDAVFADAVETFKKFCKTKEEKKEQKEGDTNYVFGKMVIASLNSLSESKQAIAIQLITDLLMKLRTEPEKIQIMLKNQN